MAWFKRPASSRKRRARAFIGTMPRPTLICHQNNWVFCADEAVDQRIGFGSDVPFLLHQVREPKRHAVDKYGGVSAGDDVRNGQGFFNCPPTIAAPGLVEVDSRPHFYVAHFGGGQIDTATLGFHQPFSMAAFARPRAAKHKRDLGRITRPDRRFGPIHDRKPVTGLSLP